LPSPANDRILPRERIVWMTDEEARAALLGHWHLVSCTAHGKDGTRSLPVGSEAVGEIIYTRDGQMSSQLMSGGADDPGTLPYHGYLGSFSVDAARGIVTHHVTAAWDRTMVGTDQERRFTLDGDRLTLEADRGDWTAHVVWRRFGRD
jgi:hypothetical protein